MYLKPAKKGESPVYLLRWLNEERHPNEFAPPRPPSRYGKNTRASRKRIVALIQALQTATRLATKVEKGEWLNYRANWPRDIRNHFDAIDKVLFEYPTRPDIGIREKDGNSGLEINFGSTTGRALGEQIAVFTIIRLLNGGLINDIHQCACERWFFAKKKDQRSCSAACRHKLYEQTPEAKMKRKAYMQEYHRLRQSGKVK